MSRFVVDLGGLKLSTDQEDAIASAIQKAVLGELAPHSGAKGAVFSGNYGLIPIEWRGLIWRPDFATLGEGVKQITAFANQRFGG